MSVRCSCTASKKDAEGKLFIWLLEIAFGAIYSYHLITLPCTFIKDSVPI